MYGVGSGPVSFFSMWLSNFSNTIYWRDCLFPIVYSWLLHCSVIDHKCIGLFLGSLFCSINLCLLLCQCHPVLLQLCNIVWNQRAPCLQLCSFSGLLWLFHVFSDSIYILRLFYVGKNAIGILVGTVLNLWIILDSMDT